MRILDSNWSSSCKCEANRKLQTAIRFDLINFDFNWELKQISKQRSKRPPEIKMEINLPTQKSSYKYDEMND